jgi:hypothetical protein
MASGAGQGGMLNCARMDMLEAVCFSTQIYKTGAPMPVLSFCPNPSLARRSGRRPSRHGAGPSQSRHHRRAPGASVTAASRPPRAHRRGGHPP